MLCATGPGQSLGVAEPGEHLAAPGTGQSDPPRGAAEPGHQGRLDEPLGVEGKVEGAGPQLTTEVGHRRPGSGRQGSTAPRPGTHLDHLVDRGMAVDHRPEGRVDRPRHVDVASPVTDDLGERPGVDDVAEGGQPDDQQTHQAECSAPSTAIASGRDRVVIEMEVANPESPVGWSAGWVLAICGGTVLLVLGLLGRLSRPFANY